MGASFAYSSKLTLVNLEKDYANAQVLPVYCKTSSATAGDTLL